MADRLALEWSRLDRWPLTVLGAGPVSAPPEVVYRQLPRSIEKGCQSRSVGCPDLTGLSEREYARFCFAFSRWVTESIEKMHADSRGLDPRAVLLNDISEGPDFRRLHRLGIPMVTVFHVDVVDYFCRLYLRGVVSPERVTRWYEAICRRRWEHWVPAILRLVFGQQRDAVHRSRALVVPSSGMAALIRRCYPAVDPARVHVLPWGAWAENPDTAEVAMARAKLLSLVRTRPAFLTLSRISPEKGIDTLLIALQLNEARGEKPVTLLIAGAPAYMRGQAYLRRLRRLAGRLSQSTVHFVGHASPAEKAALFSTTDFYVMPSRHESYGLTLAEAISAGLPAISTDHYSARDLLPESDWIVPRDDPAALAAAIRSARQAWEQAARNGQKLRPATVQAPFSVAAIRLADIIDAVA